MMELLPLIKIMLDGGAFIGIVLVYFELLILKHRTNARQDEHEKRLTRIEKELGYYVEV